MAEKKKSTKSLKVTYVGGDPYEKPLFYVNNVQFSAGVFDIHIRLNRIVETTEDEARVILHGTVVMSPQHAKSFAEILNRNLAVYEQEFGAIPGDERTVVEVEDE